MQFITTVLALAGCASAASLPRAASLGSWFVQVTVDENNGVYLVAPFTSEEFPGGRLNACFDHPNDSPPFHGCDQLDFDFSYDGEYINLTQTVTKPNPATYFGSAYLPATEDLGDGRKRGEATVEVSSATA